MQLPPPRLPDDPRLARISLRKDLLAEGHDDRTIRNLLARGELHRVRYGAYVDGAAWRACGDVGQHALVVRAVLRHAGTPLVVSHESALGEWDVPIWDQSLSEVNVTRLDERAGRRGAGVRQHEGELRPGDWLERNGVLVTSPTRTALDSACVLDVEHSVAVVGDLLHRGLTTLEQLQEGAASMRHWPGSLNHALVLRLADGRCESVGEHRTLYMLWRHGLPRPEPQYEVYDPDTGELVAVLDFAWPTLGVFLEFDGRLKYQKLLRAGESASDVVVREKRREERVCRITGWRCARIGWSDLYRPETTTAHLRALVRPHSLAS